MTRVGECVYDRLTTGIYLVVAITISVRVSGYNG